MPRSSLMFTVHGSLLTAPALMANDPTSNHPHPPSQQPPHPRRSTIHATAWTLLLVAARLRRRPKAGTDPGDAPAPPAYSATAGRRERVLEAGDPVDVNLASGSRGAWGRGRRHDHYQRHQREREFLQYHHDDASQDALPHAYHPGVGEHAAMQGPPRYPWLLFANTTGDDSDAADDGHEVDAHDGLAPPRYDPRDAPLPPLPPSVSGSSTPSSSRTPTPLPVLLTARPPPPPPSPPLPPCDPLLCPGRGLCGAHWPQTCPSPSPSRAIESPSPELDSGHALPAPSPCASSVGPAL